MKTRSLIAALALSTACSVVTAADGLITLASPFSVAETMQRLISGVQARNLSIANRIDHSAAASGVGMVLRPTQLLIFGSPALGTPLMVCSQTLGIDLPLKGLVWQDEAGKVFLTYNDLKFVGKRHDVKHCPALDTVAKNYSQLMQETVDPAR